MHADGSDLRHYDGSDLDLSIAEREGPDVVSEVGHMLLDFFYFGIQLYILLSPYFFSFLYIF